MPVGVGVLGVAVEHNTLNVHKKGILLRSTQISNVN